MQSGLWCERMIKRRQYSQRMDGLDQEPAYDELFEPLALAIGRLVVGGAVLERTLLIELIWRQVGRDGADAVFGRGLIADLERESGGALLRRLVSLEFPEESAEKVREVIRGRNHFVHRLLEDPEFLKAYASREGVDPIVQRVEALTGDLYAVIGELEAGAISGVESMFGLSGPAMLELIKDVDPDAVDDETMREQLVALRGFSPDLMES